MCPFFSDLKFSVDVRSKNNFKKSNIGKIRTKAEGFSLHTEQNYLNLYDPVRTLLLYVNIPMLLMPLTLINHQSYQPSFSCF